MGAKQDGAGCLNGSPGPKAGLWSPLASFVVLSFGKNRLGRGGCDLFRIRLQV